MKALFISGLLMAILGTGKSDVLTGRWESKPSVNGVVTGVVFKANNTFEGYVNRKPFVSAKYTLQDSVISFTDNGCNGVSAVYKTVLFSYGDSLRFELISDSCAPRAKGMQELILGKVK